MNVWGKTCSFNINCTDSSNYISVELSLEELNGLKHLLDTNNATALEGYFSNNIILTTNDKQRLPLEYLSISKAENNQNVLLQLYYKKGK